MTNGDRIRQMTNEELFSNYFYATNCTDCDFCSECRSYCKMISCDDRKHVCHEMWLKFLDMEVMD